MRSQRGESAVRALPTGCLAAVTLALAWRQDGSVLAADWLPYATLVALLLATVCISSGCRMSRLPLACAALIGCFGLWTGISASWSPVPSLARDEFLLSSLYGLTFALQASTLRTERSRTIAVAMLTLTLGASAVGVAAQARFGGDPAVMYPDGRLTVPVSYVNAQAALFLVGLWPALVIAARRSERALVRAFSLAAAVAMLAGWLGTQSKGGAIALALSTLAAFTVLPDRLRLLVPTVVATLLVAAQYHPLTAPFREQGDVEVARQAGGVALALAAVALGLGLVYALADNRLRVPLSVRRGGGIAVVAAAVVLVGVGAWEADQRIDEPRTFLAGQWESFKNPLATESGSSHLVNLGSNRYDFWQVSLAGFKDHPLGGIGGRGFGSIYLEQRDSAETPARAHSLPLDALLETGLVGFLLLASGLVLAFVGLVRRRHTLAGAAAIGAFAYFAVHATGDWIWTFPAVGLPVFALIGIGLASAEGRSITGRAATIAAAGVTAFALLAFVPPWLSARITERALDGSAAPEALAWARRLDPLAMEPLFAEAALADDPARAIAALERAVEKQPRSVAARYQLGLTYLRAGNVDAARPELLAAQRLFPGSEDIRRALAATDRLGP